MTNKASRSKDYAPPVFTPYPFFVQVRKKENGNYCVKTNTHMLDDLMIEQDIDLNYITLPYCGIDCDIRLDCDDTELHQRICLNFDNNSAYHIFLQERHPSFPNAFTNLAHVLNHPTAFHDAKASLNAFNGKPILFLGAGPSLEANFEVVRAVRELNNITIIAGGSANRVLCKHGIFPHYALAYDPNQVEKTVVFDHLTDEYMDNVAFITTLGLYSECFKRIKKGYLVCTGAMEKFYELLLDNPTIVSEGKSSVTNMITRYSELLGVSDLYFLGVDLMFREGSLHQYADIDTIKNEKTVDYELINNEHTGGKDVETRIAWCREAQDIVQDVAKHNYKFHQLSQRSLLSDYWEFPKEDINQLLSIEGDRGKMVDTLPMFDRRKAMKVMKDLHTEISYLYEETQRLRSLKKFIKEQQPNSKILKNIIYSYLIVQDFREIRTSEWDDSLIRTVIAKFKGYIEGFYEENVRELLN